MKPDELTVGNLGELLSKLLEQVDDKISPWDVVLKVEWRSNAYRQLATALGPRYELATLASYELYDKYAGEPSPGVDEYRPDRMTQQQCHFEVKKFCETMPERLRDGGGLVFFGQPGTGKDHFMAACMYWAILRHGFSVKWRDGPMFAQEIREHVGGSESERDLIDRYVEPLILAISDPIPPKGGTSEWITDTLQRIIDRRYRACKSTWATINVRDGQEAERRLAAPLVDRLRHGSLCLQCEWESYRLQNHN